MKTNKPKLNKNTLYFAWGSADGRVKRHLIVSVWNKKSQKWITHKFFIMKSDYYFCALRIAELASKEAKEIDYWTLWVQY